ncbi:hypothetical protein FRC07_003121 [Ceratobasidium sp. 392]|nr:hypothetical protein FRC07_003121 [Ceratobasidium sp. 392]
MESMIQALESLHLVLGPKPDDPEEGASEWVELENWISPSTISQLRQLTHLTIRLDFSDSDKVESITRRELENFSHLPLEYVLIRGLQLDPYMVEDEDIEHPYEFLARLWPNIQELHWPDQPAKSRHLTYFAILPNLRCLTLNVKLMPAPEDLEDIETGLKTFQVLECSKPKSFRSEPESHKQAARFLCHLWPNLSLAWNKQYFYSKYSEPCMNRLRAAIKEEQNRRNLA